MADSPLNLIAKWANDHDNWIRSLVGVLMSAGVEPTDDEIDLVYKKFLVEKQLSTGDLQPVLPISPPEAAADADSILLLDTLSAVKGVNKLAENQKIDFNANVTVLFGENGAGKSGYVRIIKRIASGRSAEEILPDVGSANPIVQPEAVVDYEFEGTKNSFHWHNETGVSPFNRIDVFDSRSTLIHVDDELSYVYTPKDVALFSVLIASLERVKAKLDAQIQETTPDTKGYVGRFSRGTQVFTLVETLGAATDIAKLKQLGAVSKDELAAIPQLRERVEALQGGSIEARIKNAQSEKTFAARVLGAIDRVATFDPDTYNQALEELSVALDNQSKSGEAAFKGTGIPEVLSEPWSAFIQRGQHYLEGLNEQDYPQEGDRCIYCRQPLDDAALHLIRKYKEFLTNKLQDEVTKSETAVRMAAGKLQDFEITGLLKEVTDLLEVETDQAVKQLLGRIKDALDQCGTVRAKVLLKEPIAKSDVPELSTLKLTMTDRIEAANELVTNLTAQSEERQRLYLQELQSLREIEARATLSDLLPSILKAVEAAKWCDRATIVANSFRSLSRSLTDLAKTASEDLLNHDFEDLFRAECKALKAPTVKLDFPGRKGAAARKKSIASKYRLSSILSEGEQKVIALADFLAEASMKRTSAPIIFDDPINSLDYKRMSYVVDRIVELAQKRQVIIFTHNIWFTTEILARYEKDRGKCSYYDVSEGEDYRGVVTGGTHPRTDSFNSLKSRLNKLIQDAGALQGETQDAVIEKGYEYLRSLCEVTVEQELLCSITRRYQPNVMMTQIENLRPERLEEALKIIYPIFEKCCRYIASHSQPLETLNVRPTLAELKEDLQNVLNAKDKYKDDKGVAVPAL